MQYRTGDKVRFLNEVGEGVIVNILPKGKVLVLTSDGFEVEYLATQIVLSDPDLLEERKKETIDKRNFENKKWEPSDRYTDFDSPKLDEAVYLAIECPDINCLGSSNLKINLLNNTSLNVLVSVNRELSKNLFESILQTHVKAGANVQCGEIRNKELNNLLPFRLDFIFYADTVCNLPDPLYVNTKLKPLKVLNANNYKKLEGFSGFFYLIKILDPRNPKETLQNEDDEIERIMQAAPKVKRDKQLDFLEVDLHAEALLEDHATMQPAEILAFQLSAFKQKLEYAINKRCKRVVFIHGVGNGVLKTEIHKILKEYVDLKFRDASPLKYGYGATEVLIDF